MTSLNTLWKEIKAVQHEDLENEVGETFLDAERMIDNYEGCYPDKLEILHIHKDTVEPDDVERYNHLVDTIKSLVFINAYGDDLDEIAYGFEDDGIDFDDEEGKNAYYRKLQSDVDAYEHSNPDTSKDDEEFRSHIMKKAIADSVKFSFQDWIFI